MTQLSNRQYPLLKTFTELSGYLSISQAQTFDQRPFRSLLMREWIAYHPGRGFSITRAGRDAWEEFRHTKILRANPNMPLTRYFDPVAYGLTENPYRKLHVMPHRGAAA